MPCPVWSHRPDAAGLFFSFASQPDPRAEKAALPCSRFLTHMKNFSASHKTDKLHFLPFPGKLTPRNPIVSKDTVAYIGENRKFSPFSTSRQAMKEAFQWSMKSENIGGGCLKAWLDPWLTDMNPVLSHLFYWLYFIIAFVFRKSSKL